MVGIFCKLLRCDGTLEEAAMAIGLRWANVDVLFVEFLLICLALAHHEIAVGRQLAVL